MIESRFFVGVNVIFLRDIFDNKNGRNSRLPPRMILSLLWPFLLRLSFPFARWRWTERRICPKNVYFLIYVDTSTSSVHTQQWANRNARTTSSYSFIDLVVERGYKYMRAVHCDLSYLYVSFSRLIQSYNAAKSSNPIQRIKESCDQDQQRCSGTQRRKEAKTPTKGDLLDLHLQGPQASPPRHGYFVESDVNHVSSSFPSTSPMLTLVLLSRNSFVNDIFERIAAESSRLSHYNKRSTISSREIQTAVRLLLPGELAKHAVSEGTKAVTKYTSAK